MIPFLRLLHNRPSRVIQAREGAGRYGYDFPEPITIRGLELRREPLGATLELLQVDGGVSSLWLPLGEPIE